MNTQNITFNLSNYENNNYPHWKNIVVEFIRDDRKGKWFSNAGYANLALDTDNTIQVALPIIPSISFIDLGMKKIIEYGCLAPNKIGRLRLFLDEIESSLGKPEDNPDAISYYKINGNSFTKNHICIFTIVLNDIDFDFCAEFVPKYGTWVASNNQYGIKISGGDGNSFNSIDELTYSFSKSFATLVEIH